MPTQIIPFNPKYINNFRDLNIAWLEKYFYVEPKDKELLENCEKSIIEKGGFIFFAEYDGKIVGCFSFIPFNDTIFELGKMAVDPKFQGYKIGQSLLGFAIDFAKEKQWSKIVLYSSSKLPTAVYIYEKYGFKHVELEKDLPYVRSDVKMELELNLEK
ncbi:GNAT family N-acetyltransferase [Maribacter sp. HTCC2170]|uniref:GNAT family N-acetyltransferase n=1 Tax=Maribacter sp. (strain HTCC2170 / KCCM 42371) TaxID=313603 RepID=UPI00006B21CB|nr:GNAT family N-acetyltransferase [Maribacter sp. HTCC2170]EAR00299.1 transcriptional regulator, MarR family protein [Maribacter sp. HTCC2170]